MSDPAIEAAQRAWGFDKDAKFFERTVGQMSVAAAREMAKTVQELHTPVVFTSPDGERWIECESCRGEYWPCETSKKVYSSEELGDKE
ncbi:hypothetical protein [Mycobacteroides abscessus]|uniref:hypothetical protein n=1 Tax=Mycobacteroides abscessus TaxID=36809 RepID=UPI00092722A5|nr:hypothetical protein [Mycobacteroides abscessus]SIL61291.1 Uncharacterised protein [Mycobacteroides abscessus subsp. abscessus]